MKNKKNPLVLACLIVLVLPACVLVGFLVSNTFKEPEPSYEGRTLSQWFGFWIKSFDEGDSAADEKSKLAIKQMGTNAVPFLIKVIREYDFTERPSFAVVSFKILGEEAACAIPDLVKIMQDTNDSHSASYAARALGYLGKEAVPPVLEALNSPEPMMKRRAMSAISVMKYLGTNMEPAIPVLVRYTQAQDKSLYLLAIGDLGKLGLEPDISIAALTNVLAKYKDNVSIYHLSTFTNFGEQARPITNYIIPFLTDSNEYHREEAINVLRVIAPELIPTNSPPEPDNTK